MVLDSLSTGAENSIHKQSLCLDLKERHGGAVSLVVCGNSSHVNEGSVQTPGITSGKFSDTSNGTIQRAGKRQGDATLEDMYNNQYSDNDDDNDSDWEPLPKSLQILKWFCVNCTMVNFDNVFHCDVCGEHRESGILKLGYFASPLFPEGAVNENSSRVILEAKGAQYQNVSTIVGFDERMLLHKEVEMKSHPHPERPDRIRAIAAGFATAGIFPGRCASMPAREITREELQMIHSSENIEAVELTSRMVSSYFSPDTYANEHSALAARLAAGVCADLASAIFTGRAKNGFALVRPPGHHAGVKLSSGFCLHNNAAVAASAAQLAGAKNVLIVDWDVHHGNGTQEIFDKSKSVLYISLHRHEHGKFYPGTGAADKVGSMGAEGYCVNIPWSRRGVGDNDYIYAFQQVVIPIASEFAPDFTIISAGFDAARGDPLGCCDVTPAGFAQMTKMLSELSGGKLLVILEGGYNLRSISSSATAVIKVLLGEDPGYNSEELVPSRSGLRTICEVLKIQMKFWHILEAILSKLRSQWGAYAFEKTGDMDALEQRSSLGAQKTVGAAKRAAELKGMKTQLPMVDIRKGAEGASGSQAGKSAQPPAKKQSSKAPAGRSLRQTTMSKHSTTEPRKRSDPAAGDEQAARPAKKPKAAEGQRGDGADKVPSTDKGKVPVDESTIAGSKSMVPFATVPVGPSGNPAVWLDREFMRQQPLDLSKARAISRGIADVPPLRHLRWSLPNPVQLEIGRGIADMMILADQSDPRRTFVQNIEDLWGLYGATVSMVGTGLAQFINDYRCTVSLNADAQKELVESSKALDAKRKVGADLRVRLEAAEAENAKLKKQVADESRGRFEARANADRLEKLNRELAAKDAEAAQTMRDLQAQVEAAQKANDALNRQIADLNSGVEARLKTTAGENFLMGYDQGFYHIARCLWAQGGDVPDVETLRDWILTHPFTDHLRSFHPQIPFSDVELQRYIQKYAPDWDVPAVVEENLRELVHRETERDAAPEAEAEAEQVDEESGQPEEVVDLTESEANVDQMLHPSLQEENVHNEDMRPEGS